MSPSRARALVRPLLAAVPLLTVVAPAGAQGVLLELRPRVGDTLRLRLDQDLDVTATQKVRGADSTVSMKRRVTVFSRSIAQKADGRGATVLAVTDSVLVGDGQGRSARVGVPGATAALHIAPDGTTRVLDDGGVLTPEATALVSQMPATLPKRPVEPGEEWSHTAAVPLPGQPGGAPTGRLSATFRLDSLSRYGDIAYISMKGTLEQPKGGVTRGGMHYESSGTVVGVFEVDRRRGWLTGVRATITTRSSVTQPAAGTPPMTVRTRVTQWLRVLGAVDKE